MMLNERGFTLLSVLAGFMILMLLIPLFTFAMKYWMQSKPEINEFTTHEYYVFISQLEMELQESESFHISHSNRVLSLNNELGIVRYEPYQTSIRRVVNGAGHEVTLQFAGALEFLPHAAGVIIQREERGRKTSRLILHPQLLMDRRAPSPERESG